MMSSQNSDSVVFQPSAPGVKKLRVCIWVLSVFFTGALTSSVYGWLQPIITVEITNGSDEVIDRLDVEFLSGQVEWTGKVSSSIAPGQKIVFKGLADGESSYRLKARFADGSQITGGSGYTERGQTKVESIHKDKVLSTSWSFYIPHTWDTTQK